MFKLSSETELLECFRPFDREEVILPQDLRFPIFVKDYFTWLEPSGCRVYVVFSDRTGSAPLGISFRRDTSGSPSAAMCEWCHAVRSGDNVGLLSATAAANRRVGLQLCRDLSCKEKAESAPGQHDLNESMTAHERVRRIVGRMSAFARRELF